MSVSFALRTGCLALVLFAFASPNCAAQGLVGTGAAPARREVRIGAAGVPATLDPMTAVDGVVPLLARQVFDTLVAYREGSTEIEPRLATRWAVSRDGLVWSFTLRDNARFHDATPVTAAEVAASFARHLAPETQPPSAVWAALMRGVPGVVRQVRASDARTVQFVLSQPYAPLLTVLAHPGLGIARSSTGADGVSRLVGSGPYRIVDASPGRLALEAAPGHWAGAPRAQRLVVLEVAGDDHAEAEFDSRTLDVWFPPAPPRRTDGALSVPGTRIGYLAFQTEKEPFSRKKLRQALAAALDPAVIGVALERAAVPLQSFLPPGVWARREGSPVLGGSRESVKTLLTEGAWPKGFKPTLLVPDDAAPLNRARLAASLEQMLGAADIPIQVRVEVRDAARSALQAGDHDIALLEAAVTGGDPHLLLFPLSTSEGATKGARAVNFSFYRNPRLDDVLVRASQLSFRAERQRLYQRAQALLAADMPWIPLYVDLVWAVARPEVRGLRLHPTGFHRLDAVSLDGSAAVR
jgi:peptide/nickel transport system substrate-binding protein